MSHLTRKGAAQILDRSEQIYLARVIGVALLIRVVVVAFVFRALAIPDRYHGDFGGEMGWVARSLATGHGFGSPFHLWTGATAMMPPAFPYLLSGIFRVFGLYSQQSALVLLLLDSVLSTLTCVPVYLSMRHAAGRGPARIAAWLWALYPFAIYYSAAWVWEYALTALLFTWCFYLAQRLPERGRVGAWVGFGALYGGAALANPAVLSVFPFLLGLAMWRSTSARRLMLGVMAALTLLAVLTPWTVRNYRAMHAFVPMRDGFWMEFWAGNHGDTSASNPDAAHPATNDAEMDLYVRQGELGYIAEKHALAVAWVKAHPVEFAGLCVRRALRYWTGFWSLRKDYLETQPFEIANLFFCTGVTLLMLWGIWRWWRVDRTSLMPYLIAIVVFPAAYYLTHSSMDYRQPIEPEIMMLVAMGLAGIPRLGRTAVVRRRSRDLVPL